MLAGWRVRRIAHLLAPVVFIACSGGDKIVDPGAINGQNGTLVRADSVFLVNSITAAASQAIKGLRQIQTPDLPLFGANAPQCTPSSSTASTDSNGNGVPDDRTVQYTAAACSFVNAGKATTVSGSVRTQDLGELYAVRVTYANVVITATKGDSTVKSTLSGTFEYRWTSATAAAALDNTTLLSEVRSATGTQSLTRTANLSTQFSPTSGGTIAAGRALPAGSMTVGGSLSISVLATGSGIIAGSPASGTLSVGVSTAVAMTMSASCTAEPIFNIGTIHGSVSGSSTGALTVKFVGCGGVPLKS